jgi:hypothetical protein
MSDDAETICRVLAAGEDAASADLTERQRSILETALAIWRGYQHHGRFPSEALVGDEMYAVLLAVAAAEGGDDQAAKLKSAQDGEPAVESESARASEPTEPLTCQATESESAVQRKQPELCESTERHEEAHNTARTDMREPVERDD